MQRPPSLQDFPVYNIALQQWLRHEERRLTEMDLMDCLEFNRALADLPNPVSGRGKAAKAIKHGESVDDVLDAHAEALRRAGQEAITAAQEAIATSQRERKRRQNQARRLRDRAAAEEDWTPDELDEFRSLSAD